MRTSIGFALGTLFSLIALSANAAGTSVAAPAKAAQADIEVIVVTAKRPALDAAIDEIVVAKRLGPSTVTAERAPPAMALEVPKLELAIGDRPQFRL